MENEDECRFLAQNESTLYLQKKQAGLINISPALTVEKWCLA